MHTYRKLYPGLTVEQYREEPAAEIDWALAIANLEAEMVDAKWKPVTGGR